MATNTKSTDAIVLLKADHKEIRKLFADFEKAGDNDRRPRSAWWTRSSSC